MTGHEHTSAGADGVAGVLDRMQQRLDALPARSRRRVFLETYRRTTEAVGAAVQGARFEDPDWVERWDVVFAGLYLDAHDAWLGGGAVPRPWRLAFDAPDGLPDLRHVLLGINAHVNYDLPQALLGVISDADAADRVLMDRRRRDHERIDGVLAERVAAEDGELEGATLVDRLLTPLNRLGTKRFLREARRKVWHNTDGPAGRPRGRSGGLRHPAGRARAAERGEDRRPARARPGAAAARGRRLRCDAAAARVALRPGSRRRRGT